ncbi:MAG: porin [Burkholderiaceae bacterium]|nr:porin [Burkholderiaceae bacterium]
MAAISVPAFAQSSVTMYGLIDLALNYRTNVNAAGQRALALGDAAVSDAGQGALSGSRLGFKGTEDLGGGAKALFVLEAGVTANNGQSDQQGQLFGRQAYVGLGDKDLGTLTLGRQYGSAMDYVFDFDPIGGGNMLGNEFQLWLNGIRFDNSVIYANAFGPVSVRLQYSVGGQAGSINANSTYGGNVKYKDGALSLGVFVQQTRDVNGNKLSGAGLGGVYALDPGIKLYANYYYTKHDAGFTAPFGTSQGMLNAPTLVARTDNVGVLGASYAPTANDTITLAGMYDHISNATNVGNGNKLGTVYLLAEHGLSKRTEVYGMIDYNRVSNVGPAFQALASTGENLNGVGAGQKDAVGLSLGLRHSF